MVSSKDNTPTIRASETRKDLIVRYATAATLLYGVISVSEFMNVFNHYEDDKINAGEIGLVLSGLAKTDDVEFSLHGDILSGPDFQPEFDDYADNVADIRRDQKGKPRYLPVKDEFLRYVDVGYREPEKSYAELKAYILKHGLSNRGVGLDGVDGDLIDLHEMIQSGVDTIEYLNYFTKRGYKYEGIDAVNSFMQMVMNAHNNTRLYNNNGFTPNEILEKFERPQLIPLPKEPLKLAKDKKIGVNRPCPCGSGKKYKKCCGRWD